MKKFKTPQLEVEKQITFLNIPDDQLKKSINELNEKIDKEMIRRNLMGGTELKNVIFKN